MPQIRPSKVQKRELVQEPIEEPQEIEPPPPPIRITALVVSHNRANLLRRAIAALEQSEEREKLEILVVDNGSTDGSELLEAEFPNSRFIRLPRNFGLTKALNIGVRSATGEYVLFLHEDTEASPETARVLSGVLETRNEIGAVCPLLVSPDGEPAPQIEELPHPGHLDSEWRAADPALGEQEVRYARGAALMMRRLSLQAIRQIDERYGNYGSDAELCFQVWRSGKKVLLVPSTRVVHHGRTIKGSAARALLAADHQIGVAAYIRKRYGILRWIFLRLGMSLGALGGLLAFRDFGYHAGLVGLLWSGQKIDGAQRDPS